MIEYKRVKKKDLKKYGNIVNETINNKKIKSLYLKSGVFVKYDPNIITNELFIRTNNNLTY